MLHEAKSADFGGCFPPLSLLRGENPTTNIFQKGKIMELSHVLRIDQRHPFDIHIAEGTRYPFDLSAWLSPDAIRRNRFVCPDHRSSDNFDAGEAYTLGERELLMMLNGFEDDSRTFTDSVVDIMDKKDHEIKKPRASAPYGPDWYMEQTFSLEEYNSGEVYAYGMLNRIQELHDEEVNEDRHTDTDTQAWLRGEEVA